MEHHRQLLLAVLLIGLAAVCHPKQPLPPDGNPAGATAALQDLYGIFSQEIRAGAVGNVYQAVGNRFQLEGKLYVAVLKALNAYDILQATTRLPEGDRVAAASPRANRKPGRPLPLWKNPWTGLAFGSRWVLRTLRSGVFPNSTFTGKSRSRFCSRFTTPPPRPECSRSGVPV